MTAPTVPAPFVDLAGAPVALVCVDHLDGTELPAGAILTRCTEHEAAAVIPAHLVAALAADGRRAYAAAELAAPALSLLLRETLAEMNPPVGDPRLAAMCRAYTAGYEAARMVELRREFPELYA